MTAVAKKYLIDVYTLLKFTNNSSIYSFEQIPEPNYLQKYLNLIHNFEYGVTYKYNCLAASFYTKDKFIVNEDSIVAEEDINRLRAVSEMLEKYGSNLENKIAIDFARFWCLLYFLILLSFFVLSVQLIRQPDGWNLVEPVVFVITTSWFLLNYLLQVIFVGRVVSLEPLQLFPALKSWKEQRLKKFRSSRMNRVL
ncbi:hypothetical protein [Scytonema sp. NUACC26]|uniref:hypothetical protein n=1 Tax=Scytonema sp. NUACC26 TaxID=3140176 RepID=UPI0034DBC778